MQVQIGDGILELVQGDITEQDTDAIVNAANSSLLGGGGVDGAIHRAAGPGLLEECRKLKSCQTGSAKITKGHKLKAKHIIHAVGPVYRSGKQGEAGLLASAYRTSLELASENGCGSIAFPAISTGAYCYPMEDAARIAFRTTIDFMAEHPDLRLVRFVLYDEYALKIHTRVLEQVLAA